MYFLNRLTPFAAYPSRPLFQLIKKLMRWLAGCPHRPIFYPAGIDVNGSHELKQEVSVGQFRDATLSNNLAMFADGGERKSRHDHRTIACTVTTYGGVATDWRASTNGSQAPNSTDSELQTYFIAAKLATVARPVQAFLGTLAPGPTPIYEDSKPTIAIVQSPNITPRARHNGSYYAFAHEQYMNETSEPVYISTSLQPADIGTKALPRPLRTRHEEYLHGKRYYPAEGTEHYELLKLSTYDQPFRPDPITNEST
jgi:hypothetical protein